MNPNFNFDAEGVFDQPIKPLRIRPRRKPKQHWRKKWIQMSEPLTTEQSVVRNVARTLRSTWHRVKGLREGRVTLKFDPPATAGRVLGLSDISKDNWTFLDCDYDALPKQRSTKRPGINLSSSYDVRTYEAVNRIVDILSAELAGSEKT